MAGPSQRLLVCAKPTDSICPQIILHPREHQDHDHELLPGHAHVLCTEELHNWLQKPEVGIAMDAPSPPSSL